MKIEMRLSAQSNLEIKSNPFDVQYKDFLIELSADKKGIVNHVSISQRIDATDKDYLNQWKEVEKLKNIGTVSENHVPFPLHAIDKKMIRVLKLLENVLVDEGNLTLEWKTLNCHYNPENESEHELIKSGQICNSWGRILHVTNPRIIQDPTAITCRMEYSEGLDIELDFFKHATLAIKAENYIEAFFNLYLILESHYAGGKFKYQKKVFKENKALCELIKELIEDHTTMKRYEKILARDKELTVDNVLDTLVNIRMKLFHFLDINNPERFINYNNQEEYRDHVFTLQDIVWRCMRKRHADLKRIEEVINPQTADR